MVISRLYKDNKKTVMPGTDRASPATLVMPGPDRASPATLVMPGTDRASPAYPCPTATLCPSGRYGPPALSLPRVCSYRCIRWAPPIHEDMGVYAARRA